MVAVLLPAVFAGLGVNLLTHVLLNHLRRAERNFERRFQLADYVVVRDASLANGLLSIALEREGQIVAGLIYNPANDDMYVAEKGQGAWQNNHRLRVAARRDFADALVGCGVGPLARAKDHPRFKSELSSVLARAANIRRLGAASLDLAHVAAGRLDAYWERGLNSWDIGAGIILVREAGGFVSDGEGGEDMLESGSICVGNEIMHRNLLALLRKSAVESASGADKSPA